MRRLLFALFFGSAATLSASTWVTSNPGIYFDIPMQFQQDASSVFLAGYTLNGSFRFDGRIEKRDLATSALVSGFGTAGVVTYANATDSYILTQLVLQGSSLYAGYLRSVTYTTEIRLEKRDTTTGALDAAFGTAGVVTLTDPIGRILSDGSYLYLFGATGPSGSSAALIEKRNLADGSLVTAFGTAGRMVLDATVNDDRFSNALISGSSLVVTGVYGALSYAAGSGSASLQRRSSSTGALDGSFAAGAGLTGTACASVSGLGEDAGAYYVYGTDYSLGGNDQQVLLAKHNKSSGALDSSFDGDGLYYHNPGALNDASTGLLLDGSGGAYLCMASYVSSTDVAWRVQKLSTATGTLDPSFATAGQYDLNPGAAGDLATTLLLNAGSLYVVGSETLAGLDSQWRVEKLSVGPAPTNTYSPTVSPSFTASPAVSATFTPTITRSSSPSPSYTPSAAIGMPYNENFDGASPGWVATGLWHAVDTGSADPYALAQSPSRSWWYGQASSGTYDTVGVANSGTLTSPVLAISGSPSLTFQSWYQTESTATTWDVRWLQISVNGGAFVNLQQFSGDTMSVWGQKTVSLAAYNGSNVQLRFYFDTIDAGANAYRGWYVDSLMVGPVPSPTSTPTRTSSATVTPSPSITGTRTISATVTPSPSITATRTISATLTASATVTPSPSITVTRTVSPTFSASPSFSASATPASAGLPEAVDDLSLAFTAGGNATWYLETTTTYNGGDAAQSGDINDGQSVYMEASFTGPGIVSFYWSVSSESSFDYLRVAVDGVNQGPGISGAVAWTANSVTLGAGTHLVRWTYSKDGSVSSGADAGWVDFVQFTLTTPTSTPTISATRTVTPSFSASPSISATNTISPTFTVTPPALFFDDFSTNLGWTYGTEWARGPAVAGSGDPGTDHSPSADNNVAGVVLGGLYTTTIHSYYYLTSPVINTAGQSTVTLSFWRWLNSDYTPYVTNAIEVFNGTAWITVWQSAGTGIYESAWSYQSYDLSAYANANMQIRFGHTVAGSAISYGGWTLDDVEVDTVPLVGSPTRSPTPTRTATATRTPAPGTSTPTPSRTRSATSTATPTGTRTATRTASPTVTVTATVTISATITLSPTITETFTISPTPSISPTFTASPAYAPERVGKVFSYPNPFKPGPGRLCTIRFQPCNGASLEIFDLAARRVGEVSAADIKSSAGMAVWDGRLYNDSIAAPGLYFILLRSENGVLSNKLTVIR